MMTTEPVAISFTDEECKNMPDEVCPNIEDSNECGENHPLLQVSVDTFIPRRQKLVLPEILTFFYFLTVMTYLPLQQYWLFDRFSHQYGWKEGNNTESPACSNSSLTPNTTLEIEKKVQSLTNRYVMYTCFISSVTAIFPTLFLGPLTDRFGRKFALFFNLTLLFCSMLLILMVVHFDLSPNLMLVSSFIQGLGGSYGLYLAAALGMIADITSIGKQRTIRVATLEMSLALGISVGQSTSGIWVKSLGYQWPMVFCLGLIILGLVFLFFCIPETYHSPHQEHQPFSCKSLLQPFSFYVKAAPNGRRLKLLACLLIFLIFTGSNNSESNFSMLYLFHQPFCWQKMKISVFLGVQTLIKWIIIMSSVHLGKRVISEPVFALMGIVSCIASYLVKGLAKDSSLIFIGAGVGLLTDIVSPMSRAMMSKAVSHTEQGSLFSGIGVLQMVMTALCGVVMSTIYKAGLHTFLGLPYLVLSCLSAISAVIVIYLIIQRRRHPESEDPVDAEERFVN